MNNIKIFKNIEFGEIRTLEQDGKPLFCGSDVAKALGYAKPQNAIDAHCRYALKRGIPHPQSPEKTIEMLFLRQISGSGQTAGPAPPEPPTRMPGLAARPECPKGDVPPVPIHLLPPSWRSFCSFNRS